MQLPYRKPPQFSQVQTDPLVTPEKLRALEARLAKLLAGRPALATEVHRLAQNGDFSENAEYQMAKGRLRGMNDEIARLEFEINHAQIIRAASTDTVAVGHRVEILLDGVRREYHLLGSAETNPGAGVISYASPLGAALIDHAVGDEFLIELAGKKMACQIISIQ